MKICSITPSYPRYIGDWKGGEWTRYLSNALLTKSVNTEVVCADDILVDEENFNKKIKIHRFRYWFTRKNQVLGYGIMENIKMYGLAKIQIPFFLLSFFIKSLKVARACDLMHAQWIYSGLIAIIIKFFYKKPIVLTLHNANFKDYPEWVVKIVLKNVDAIISPHPELTARANTYDCSEIFEIKNLIDYEKFNYKNKEKYSSLKIMADLKEKLINKTVVSFIARFDDWKDPIMFVNAIPKILKENDNIHFLIVGEGFLEKKIRNIINEFKIYSHVTFLGSRKDIENILSITDIFTALSTLENIWSVILIETVAMKVPCVITKAGETEKYFSNDEDAILVPVGDSNALSDGIISLINDYKLRVDLADNAYALLERHGFLSVEKVAEDTKRVYEYVIDGGNNF